MKCTNCGSTLRKVDRREEMSELEEDATDGQQADYYAAELSGDRGAWNLCIVEYHCPKCGLTHQLQHDDLPNYTGLIFGWHQKARDEDDDFSRFVFEYLAFIAYLRNHLFIEETRDRQVIQALKRDQMRRVQYLNYVNNDGQLRCVLQRLMDELKVRPLHNSSLDLDCPENDIWWNCSGLQPVLRETSRRGVIRSVDDWENIVEFWYGVRNNLFHGGKNPSIERDQFLVEHAYETLKVFMETELSVLRRQNA